MHELVFWLGMPAQSVYSFAAWARQLCEVSGYMDFGASVILNICICLSRDIPHLVGGAGGAYYRLWLASFCGSQLGGSLTLPIFG